MSDLKTAVGVCEEVSEKNGWTSFAIDVGSQYPLRLSTKLDPLVELGRAASKDGGKFTWTYSEQESDRINEKSGKPYVNRYLSGVEKASENAQNATPSESVQTKADVDWDAKERRDYRSRAWAQTLAAFQHTIKVDEDPEEVFKRLQPFQRKVFTDVCGSFAFPADESDIPF